jgi:hypothetical protein
MMNNKNVKKMAKQITEEQTEKILQELLGLEYIEDPIELRNTIIIRLDGLTKLERYTLDMKLGQRVSEIEAGIIPNPFLKIIISFVLSLGIFYLLFSYQLFIILKIILYPFGTIFGIMGLIYIYNIFTNKK